MCQRHGVVTARAHLAQHVVRELWRGRGSGRAGRRRGIGVAPDERRRAKESEGERRREKEREGERRREKERKGVVLAPRQHHVI